jgi:hypothetical protein
MTSKVPLPLTTQQVRYFQSVVGDDSMSSKNREMSARILKEHWASVSTILITQEEAGDRSGKGRRHEQEQPEQAAAAAASSSLQQAQQQQPAAAAAASSSQQQAQQPQPAAAAAASSSQQQAQQPQQQQQQAEGQQLSTELNAAIST